MLESEVQKKVAASLASPQPVDPNTGAGRATVQVASQVIGRIGGQALNAIIENRGRLFEIFPLVWVVGAAASGKSTVMGVLRSAYPNIPVIHDRPALVQAIREKAVCSQQKSLPTVVDHSVLRDAFARIARTAEHSPLAMIELGRGRTASGLESDPMSLSFALREIPEAAIKRSLFLYLSAPLPERLARNDRRPHAEESPEEAIPNVRCSDETMRVVFHDVDAEALLDRSDLSFIELRNVVNRDDFIDLLECLFGGKR